MQFQSSKCTFMANDNYTHLGNTKRTLGSGPGFHRSPVPPESLPTPYIHTEGSCFGSKTQGHCNPLKYISMS